MLPRKLLSIGLTLVLSSASSYCKPDHPFSSSDSAFGSSLVLVSLSAHPDDEDGATLAYYSRIRGVKTYTIFFTRGEGGQNELGSELYEDLGAIRTKEALEAARILGSEAYFLGYPDFGFSKTAKETFAKWGGKDSVVARLVYFIRALRPDVMITNHDTVTTKPNRQHGNHQAVGITTFDAFEKAADPAFHPEQLHGAIKPWQVKKMFSRFFNRDSMPWPPDVITIDVSQRNREGESMEAISISALHQHRSQGLARITLDSIPAFIRQHVYRIMRQDRSYALNPDDLFSDVQPALHHPVEVGSPVPAIIPTPLPKKVEDVHAVVSKQSSVGLIKTYDNAIQQLLTGFHVSFDLVDSLLLSEGDLSIFSTIIIDMRAYFFRQDLVQHNDRLLDYMRRGGNVVCFYHKPGDWNGKNFAPYSITLTGERVTEEDAPVTLLQPAHPFFHLPNLISSPAWTGWAQERSIYLPSEDTMKTSSRYTRLLSMSDEDERQPSTSLLWTQYGNGTYTYCALVLYRQLRILNEGAVRLFFNMISQPRH